MCVGGVAHAQVIGSTCGIRVYHAHKAMCVAASSRFWWWLRRILVKGFVVAGVGRVFQWVECPSCREVCQAWYREYVRSLVDGLSFVQAAHVVGVSKRTGRVWRHGRTRSRGWCERAGIAPQVHWCRLYVTCHPHRISQGFLSFKERMLIFGWRVEGLSIRDIARRLGRSPSAVSRELKRNGMTSTCDNPYIAHMRAGAPHTPKGAHMRRSSLVGHHLGQA